MHEPLKNCPFCGNQPEPTGHYAVICMGCGVAGPSAGDFEEASVLWNTRTPQPTQAQAGAVPLTESEMGEGWRKFQETLDDSMAADPAGVRNMGREHWLSWAHWKAACSFARGIKGGQHG